MKRLRRSLSFNCIGLIWAQTLERWVSFGVWCRTSLRQTQIFKFLFFSAQPFLVFYYCNFNWGSRSLLLKWVVICWALSYGEKTKKPYYLVYESKLDRWNGPLKQRLLNFALLFFIEHVISLLWLISIQRRQPCATML